MKTNRTLINVIAKAGLIPASTQQQYCIWGLMDSPVQVQPPKTAQELVEKIEECLETDDLLLVREVDFDVIEQYLQTQQRGNLIVEDQSFELLFGRTKFQGEYILPYTKLDSMDILLGENTRLVYGERLPNMVFFTEVREVIVKSSPMFFVCKGREE